jgi:Type IV secretory pathway, VirB2 components (pilins)
MLVLFSFVALVVFGESAWATSVQENQALPYEAWLASVKKSISGPVAIGLSLIGIVGCGAMLIFGGEISTFLKTLVYIVLVMAFLVGASTLMDKFFTDGAVIMVMQSTATGSGGLQWLV